MRVFFLIDGLGTGGAQRSLAEQLPLFARAGIEPTVICLAHKHEGVEDAVIADGFDVRFLADGPFPKRVIELRRMLRRDRPAVLNTCLFDSDVLGRVAAARLPVRVVTSLVNSPYGEARRSDPNVRASRLAAARAVDGWTARHLTDHFHAITQDVKDHIVETLDVDPGAITVVPRGRDPERLGGPSRPRRQAARAALDIPDGAEVVVNVARQEFQKGQRFLLEAAPAILGARPEAVVVIAGRRGHASDELDRLHHDLALGDRVRFLGHRDDVAEVLAAADVFAFPSLYEGLGGALIEAMALGLPIVASELAVFREVVEPGRNALLVPTADGDALAQAVTGLLADSDRRAAFAAHSRRLFEERYTLERSADALAQVLLRAGAPTADRSRVTRS